MQTQDLTYSNNQNRLAPELPTIERFRDSEGNIPFWDDPSVQGGIDRPPNYKPRTDIQKVLADFYNNRTQDIDDLILTIIRDAICANENQLRRLLKVQGVSSSRLSQRLRYMATLGLTDKWRLESPDMEGPKPPTPWSVGLSGYLFLKHYYSDRVMDPTRLIVKGGDKSVQKYVAVNEIRTQLYEYQALKGWDWHPKIDENHKLGIPLAVAKMNGPRGEFLLFIERLQQGKEYFGYIIPRLKLWNQVYLKYRFLPTIKFPQTSGVKFPQTSGVVLLSVGTDAMAHHVASRIELEAPHLPIWFITDERLDQYGLVHSVLVYKDRQLQPFPMTFLGERIER